MNDMIIGQNGASGVPAAELIKDTDTKGFMADVIEVSKKVPVLVDFWAPWCGPCKQLTPLLEKVVKQANGKVRLVKINVDENQQIAAQMRVQSIPAVFAFVNGQPIDGFMGALPEGQIRQFIDKLGSKGSLAEEIAAAMKVAEEAMQRKPLMKPRTFWGKFSASIPHMLQPSPILQNARLNSATSKERLQPWPRFRLTKRQTPMLSAPLPPLIWRFTPLTPVSSINCKKLLRQIPMTLQNAWSLLWL